MASLEHFEEKHKKILVVNWVFGNRCNYRCSYCPSDLHDGSEEQFFRPDLFPLVQDFCTRLIRAFPQQQICFLFAGGEFTLYQHFFPLLQSIKSQGAQVALVSNGSKPLSFWKEAVKLLDHVSFSFHPEFSQAPHFSDVLELTSQELSVHVNMMMHPHYFDSTLEHARRFLQGSSRLTLSLQPLLQNLGEKLYSYSDDQLQILRDGIQHNFSTEEAALHFSYRGDMLLTERGKKSRVTASQLIAQGRNSWIGMKCYAGMENIVIDVDGEIYRSWCFTQADHPAPEEGYLGNVFEGTVSFAQSPVLCHKPFCHCTLDIMCTKEKARG